MTLGQAYSPTDIALAIVPKATALPPLSPLVVSTIRATPTDHIMPVERPCRNRATTSKLIVLPNQSNNVVIDRVVKPNNSGVRRLPYLSFDLISVHLDDEVGKY